MRFLCTSSTVCNKTRIWFMKNFNAYTQGILTDKTAANSQFYSCNAFQIMSFNG